MTTPSDGPPPHLARHVLEAVAVWVGLMGLLFLACELVDRTWLSELPGDSRSDARLFRVLATSLTAAVVTAVWMLWRRIPSLQRSLGAHGGGGVPRGTHRAALAPWFLGLRRVALGVLTAIVAATTVGRHVPAASILPLWGGTAALLFFGSPYQFAGHGRAGTPDRERVGTRRWGAARNDSNQTRSAGST